jgi:hypothetical protein
MPSTTLNRFAAALALSFAFLLCTCATRNASRTRNSGNAKYPARAPGCKIALFHSEIPPVPSGWDDLGVVEVGCYLDDGENQCLQKLRAEACRKGGDIIYNVPKRPLRPEERAMVFRGTVAHTRPTEKEKEVAREPEPPPETGPVVPLSRPSAAADGGASTDAAAAPNHAGTKP